MLQKELPWLSVPGSETAKGPRSCGGHLGVTHQEKDRAGPGSGQQGIEGVWSRCFTVLAQKSQGGAGEVTLQGQGGLQ